MREALEGFCYVVVGMAFCAVMIYVTICTLCGVVLPLSAIFGG